MGLRGGGAVFGDAPDMDKPASLSRIDDGAMVEKPDVFAEKVSIEQVDVSASFQKKSGIVSLPINIRALYGGNRYFFRRLAGGTPTLSVSFRSSGVARWFASLVLFLSLAALFAAAIRMKLALFGTAGALRKSFETSVLALLALLAVVSPVAAVIVLLLGIAGIALGPRVMARVSA
jgi:hypothetical protein